MKTPSLATDQVFVFDACAVIALLDDEEGAGAVEGILQNPSQRCVLHIINLCEVYYHVVRSAGEQRAGQVEEALGFYGFEFDDSLPNALWKAAGQLKALWRRISLADCFALALAQQNGGALVTSDHHELDRLVAAGVCPIEFIR